MTRAGELVVDFVAVGSGAAGLTGALVAAAAGAKVAVLEKGELVGGTTAVSGGGAWIPCNDHAREVGVEDSPEEALAYLRACAGDAGDDAHLVSLVEHGPGLVRRLEELGLAFRAWPSVGGTIDYRPWLPGAKHGGRTLIPPRFRVADLGEWGPRVRTGPISRWTLDSFDYYAERLHLAPPGSGAPSRASSLPGPIEFFASGTALIGQLLRAALAHGVSISTDARAERLLVEEGRVVGVDATRDGAPLRVRARDGVLLAAGSYANNAELRRLWLQRPHEFTCDVAENTGDGHLMGIAAGAQVAGLGDAWWCPILRKGLAFGSEVGAGHLSSTTPRVFPHTLIVDGRGRRFMNEALNKYDAAEAFGLKEGGSPRNLPAYFCFDGQGAAKYDMLASLVPDGDRPEWLVVADSVAALADRLGVDRGALTATVERFNGFARAGVDEDFGRGASAWDRAWGDPANGPNPSLGTLERPPFVALELAAGSMGTRGGLRVDGHGRVLSASRPGAPIPGLYAAGNCSNAAPAGSYPGGGTTIGAAMTFGSLAAVHAVRSRRDDPR
jgi:3-oxosteroid 1-dehydrogenase